MRKIERVRRSIRWNCDADDDGNGMTFRLIRSSMNISTKSKSTSIRVVFMLCTLPYASMSLIFILNRKKKCAVDGISINNDLFDLDLS